ncbi:Protein of unknown function [Cotesia congregata]|uniref:Uncharacterized protein n=1 Tax=Cotesia congregata TaxID=51543 RepID=A0A8J2HBH7_COTCN|nr:Protein of unknown function [Cotesia congregata]
MVYTRNPYTQYAPPPWNQVKFANANSSSKTKSTLYSLQYPKSYLQLVTRQALVREKETNSQNLLVYFSLSRNVVEVPFSFRKHSFSRQYQITPPFKMSAENKDGKNVLFKFDHTFTKIASTGEWMNSPEFESPKIPTVKFSVSASI